MFSILKLALLILSIDVQNKFSIVDIGLGYVGMSENPAFTISELKVGEFQDYKLIPPAGPISFGLFVGGIKLFPSLLLDRIDKTFEFVRQLRIIPGGGIAPISLFIYSPRAIFTVYSGKTPFNVVPNLKLQIIPISDLVILTIFNPSLYTKKVYTPGPYPHFEIAPGIRGMTENFDFELKFGIRSYSLLVPSLSQAEQEAISNYQQTGAKKIVGREYNAKYGIMFFVNLTVGFSLPSYHLIRIVAERGKVEEIAAPSPELQKKLAELEKKLAELQRERTEKAAAEKAEKERKPEAEKTTVEQKPVVKLDIEMIRRMLNLSIDRYEKGSGLYLSWEIPLKESIGKNIEKIELERCKGYGCTDFTPISEFPIDITNYVDKIDENQIYCYRLSLSIVKQEEGKKPMEESVKSSRICAYASDKGELVRVYF